MLILKINSKGHTIKIPGGIHFSTPGSVDISKLNLNDVIIHLKKNGIHDFEIISKSNNLKNLNLEITKDIDPVILNELEIKELISKMSKDILDIKKQIENNRYIPSELAIQNFKNIKNNDEVEDKFIPKINTKGFKTKSKNTSIETQKTDQGDLNLISNKLSKLKKTI